MWFGRFEKVPILPNFKGMFFYVVDKIFGLSAFPQRAKGLHLNIIDKSLRAIYFKFQYSLYKIDSFLK